MIKFIEDLELNVSINAIIKLLLELRTFHKLQKSCFMVVCFTYYF